VVLNDVLVDETSKDLPSEVYLKIYDLREGALEDF
jgi:hypothetical protein